MPDDQQRKPTIIIFGFALFALVCLFALMQLAQLEDTQPFTHHAGARK